MAVFYFYRGAHKLLYARKGLERRSDVFVCAYKKLPFAQGKNREPGLQENSVRNFTGRQVPSPVKYLETCSKAGFFVFGEAGKLLCLRRDLKGGAMFLFARIKGYLSRKAKTASPACRKIPSGILPEGKATSGKIFRKPAQKQVFLLLYL